MRCVYYTLSFEECGAIPRGDARCPPHYILSRKPHSRECKDKQNKSPSIISALCFSSLFWSKLDLDARDALWSRSD
jgi:hypothetical protein